MAHPRVFPGICSAILDSYLLFPAALQSVRFRPEHQRLKRQAVATKRAPPHGPRPEDAVLFERMRPFQDAALETLALRGILSNDALEEGWVEQGDKAASPELGDRVKAANATEEDLIAALRAIAVDYQLEGANGLKHRTGLLEHRYDAV